MAVSPPRTPQAPVATSTAAVGDLLQILDFRTTLAREQTAPKMVGATSV
jgi:hypothetical protein